MKQVRFERPSASARFLALFCLFMFLSGTRELAHAQADEYQIKAAFLFHFAQLVVWPDGALNAGDPSLKLCIFADEPSRQELQTVIEGKPIGARVLHLRLISHPQEVQGCNVLFLSHDEERRQSATLKTLRGLPILTVGETANFLSDGGMIRLHADEDRIRFDINLEAADSTHLTISSRLLLLASKVIRGNATDRGR